MLREPVRVPRIRRRTFLTRPPLEQPRHQGFRALGCSRPASPAAACRAPDPYGSRSPSVSAAVATGCTGGSRGRSLLAPWCPPMSGTATEPVSGHRDHGWLRAFCPAAAEPRAANQDFPDAQNSDDRAAGLKTATRNSAARSALSLMDFPRRAKARWSRRARPRGAARDPSTTIPACPGQLGYHRVLLDLAGRTRDHGRNKAPIWGSTVSTRQELLALQRLACSI